MRWTLCFLMFVPLFLLTSTSAFAGDPVAAKEQFKLGEKLRSEGNLKLAVEAFKKSYQLDNNYEVLYDIGKAEVELGNYDNAVVYLETHLKKGGNQIDGGMKVIVEKEIKRLKYLISMGLGKGKQSTPAATIPTSEPAVAPDVPADTVEPSPPAAMPTPAPPQTESDRYFAMGMAAYERGEFKTALNYFNSSYKHHANHEALYYIGECALSLRDFAKAKESFEIFLRGGQDQVSEETREEVTQKMSHIAEIESAIAKRLAGIEAHNRGVSLNRNKQYEEAAVEFEYALKMFPDYRIYMGMGNSAAGQMDLQGAVEHWERYLLEGGDRVSMDKAALTEQKIERARVAMVQADQQGAHDAHLAAARELLSTENKEEALAEFNLAYEAIPSNQVLLEIAKTQISLKNYDEAIATYNRILDEHSDEMSEKEIKKINKKIKRAEKTKTVSNTKSKSSEHFLKGNDLAEIGAFEEAIPELEKAYAIDSNYEILLPLAQSYAGIENYKMAVKTYYIYLSKGGSRIPEETRKEIRAEASRINKLSKEKKPASEPDLL